MTVTLETDYLVVGAGAAGMAFADEIIRSSKNLHVVIVDRQATPGGHWNHAYSFVTLHQPALYYGVNSEPLGSGGGDLVSGAEIKAYYERVIAKLVATGRVSFFPLCDYQGDGRFTSLESPEQAYHVTVRKKIVDSTYTLITVPSTTPPNYEAADDVTLVPINALATLERRWVRYVVIGAGKTGMDAVLHLLSEGIDPDTISWVVSNDAWYLNRAGTMPEVIPDAMPDQLRCIAEADSPDDVFVRQEAAGHIMRLDETRWPTRYHCATITVDELKQLRRIKHVIRKGRVIRLEQSSMVLTGGTEPSEPDSLYIDCTADGLTRRPARPIFEEDHITIQPIFMCQPVYSASGLAKIELHYKDEALKNRICIPVPHPNVPEDYLPVSLATFLNLEAWGLRIGWWTLRSRLCAGHHFGLFGLIRFHVKGLWWRWRGLKKLRLFVSELEEKR